MPKSAVFMKKSKQEKSPEPGPDVGTYDPIRYNDIGAREVIKMVHSTSKKSLGRKMSIASLRRDASPKQLRFDSLNDRKRISVDSGKGRNSQNHLHESSAAYSTIEEDRKR